MRTYLGTSLTPAVYYETKASDYFNPHEPGIRTILARWGHHITGTMLDLGCGDGLVTKILKPERAIGADPSYQMLTRYSRETHGNPFLGSATAQLPPCDSVVASYSLHLEPNPNLASFRLWECGAKTIVVISPLKDTALSEVYFDLVEEVRVPVGRKAKTIYGSRYCRRETA